MISKKPKLRSVAVLGAGAWGATLAWLLSTGGHPVSLWGRDRDKMLALSQSRRHEDPVPIELCASVEITSELDDAIDGADIVIIASPSQALEQVTELLSRALSRRSGKRFPALVSAAKGISTQSLLRMSQIIESKIEGITPLSLSGPNLAFEIRSGLPTAAVLACADLELAKFVQESLHTPKFRLYASSDIIGVELGGTLKNIMAVAAGASDGLKLGVNAKSALITRGLAEMVRLATRLGAEPTTLFGLSGLGDLIATCQGPMSRNYRVGLFLAQGETVQTSEIKVGSCAEGVKTTYAVCELSQNLGINMPIASQVKATLDGRSTPHESIMALMNRPLSTE